MGVLTDAQWRVLKRALDHARSGRGRPFRDERRTVEAVLWRLKNGAPWRAVATRYEKTATSFMGVLYLAAMMDWIKHILSHTT